MSEGAGLRRAGMLLNRSWGGKRAGAGRPRTAARSNVPHRRRPVHSSEWPVLVTLRVSSRSLRSQYVFPTVRGAISAVRKSLARRRAKHQEAGGAEFFRVCEFSIQETHLHLLVEASSKAALERGIRGLSIRLAKRVNQLLFQKGRFIADRYHAHQLKTPRSVRNALVYVLANFRKHGRDKRREKIDMYSSAPYFTGFSAVFGPELPLGASRAGPVGSPGVPVDAARTWLLAKGWRRYGLISLCERPRASQNERS